MSGRYDDILGHRYTGPLRHVRMKRENRAAQFSPFAALSGHSDYIDEAMRFVEQRRILEDWETDEISAKIAYISENKGQKVSIIHFVEDDKKEGGQYLTSAGTVKKVDFYKKSIVLESLAEIKIEDIESLEFDEG